MEYSKDPIFLFCDLGVDCLWLVYQAMQYLKLLFVPKDLKIQNVTNKIFH